MPIKEVELETLEQSIDEVERKTTELTPMQTTEDQGTKTIDLSPISNRNEVIGNTPEPIKENSQTKRTFFTEKIAGMVRMKPKNKEEVITGTDKS